MPWSEHHKPRSRERILASAATLFTRQGFDGVSIDAVMQHAGLTRGAFYAHFASKSVLYTEAIRFAARQGAARLAADGASARERVERYLDARHLGGDDFHCPLACLVSDVAQQDARVRTTYTRLFEGFVDHAQAGQSAPQRRRALQRAVTMIGGLAIARTLTDEALAEELLTACRELAAALTPDSA